MIESINQVRTKPGKPGVNKVSALYLVPATQILKSTVSGAIRFDYFFVKEEDPNLIALGKHVRLRDVTDPIFKEPSMIHHLPRLESIYSRSLEINSRVLNDPYLHSYACIPADLVCILERNNIAGIYQMIDELLTLEVTVGEMSGSTLSWFFDQLLDKSNEFDYTFSLSNLILCSLSVTLRRLSGKLHEVCLEHVLALVHSVIGSNIPVTERNTYDRIKFKHVHEVYLTMTESIEPLLSPDGQSFELLLPRRNITEATFFDVPKRTGAKRVTFYDTSDFTSVPVLKDDLLSLIHLDGNGLSSIIHSQSLDFKSIGKINLEPSLNIEFSEKAFYVKMPMPACQDLKIHGSHLFAYTYIDYSNRIIWLRTTHVESKTQIMQRLSRYNVHQKNIIMGSEMSDLVHKLPASGRYTLTDVEEAAVNVTDHMMDLSIRTLEAIRVYLRPILRSAGPNPKQLPNFEIRDPLLRVVYPANIYRKGLELGRRLSAEEGGIDRNDIRFWTDVLIFYQYIICFRALPAHLVFMLQAWNNFCCVNGQIAKWTDDVLWHYLIRYLCSGGANSSDQVRSYGWNYIKKRVIEGEAKYALCREHYERQSVLLDETIDDVLYDITCVQGTSYLIDVVVRVPKSELLKM